MALKRILVHFDGSARGQRALGSALALAQRQDAHLVGCAVQADPRVPTYAAAHIPGEVITTLMEEQRRIVQEAHAEFDRIVGASGWQDRSEFIEDSGDLARSLASHGRSCDMIVVGQSEPGADATDVEDLPDNLVVESGRPVLIIPYIGERVTIGDSVMLCWTDTRESARALSDSLPLLGKASKVTVLTVGSSVASGDVAGDGAARFLAAHGISAEVRGIVTPDISVGTAILNEATDGGCDLIIMGAYGHSRLRETILGGTTRMMMTDMTIPVMMTH